MAINRIAYFLAGTLLGATAVALSKSEKGQKILSSVVQGTCKVTETMMERAEVLKEDIEDYLAEAKHTRATCVRAESAAESATACTTECSVEQKPAKVAPVIKTKVAKVVKKKA